MTTTIDSNAPLEHASAASAAATRETNSNVSPHSYLPGISNSLFVSKDAVVFKHPCTISPASSTATTSTTSLPILQLPGVVIFPGMSLPLRLSQRSWRQYVTQSIEAGKTVRIAVLTHLGPSQSQRSTWMRRASRQRWGVIASSDDTTAWHEDGQTTAPTSGAQHRADATNRRDPLVNRVGTIVTVAYTHGNDDGNGNTNDELVVTALGTGRCMLLEQLDSPQPVEMYRVHEFNDYECKRPPIQRPICSMPSLPTTSSSSTSSTTTISTNQRSRDDAIMASLSRMTPIPTHCYRMVWPWRLVQQIQLVLERIPNTSSLLPQSCTLEPMEFSFHLASNLALSQRDKLHVLQLHDTVQRLQFLLTKVLQQQQQNQTYLCCNQCQQALAHANDMFTVYGSEGTSGAHVNAHGVIHQTMTVRDLCHPVATIWYSATLWCSGTSETVDSWFPGYAWTIAHCTICDSHLGWRFDRVQPSLDNGNGNDDNGPERFWGLSGASVTTRVCAIHERHE
jgi:ATP-dependent protease La (LON) substrate-binding domain/Yippee zinc-binding/DNA-binding /Mis18, centromere assembly